MVRENDRSVINQVSNFMKQSIPQNLPFSSYAAAIAPSIAVAPYQQIYPPPPVPQFAPVQQPWIEPEPLPDPVAPILPPAYAAPVFNYYSRADAWQGGARSLDQSSSYVPQQTEEELMPQVITRGFDTGKRKKNVQAVPPNPAIPPVQPTVPAPETQYNPPQTYVPFPPFIPGTKFPQHGFVYPSCQYVPYQHLPQDHSHQWYGHPNQTVPIAPVMPSHLSGTEQPQPALSKETSKTEKKKGKKWKSEHLENRERSNSDAMGESKKEEEASKHMSSVDCSVDSIGSGGYTSDAKEGASKMLEEEEKKQAAKPAPKNEKKRKSYKKDKIKHSSKVKWVPKKPNPDLSINITTSSEVALAHGQKDKSERFLSKVMAAHDMQMRGVATEKETLLTEGQRTYYNKGAITTPRRLVPTATSQGDSDKMILQPSKDDSYSSHHANN